MYVYIHNSVCVMHVNCMVSPILCRHMKVRSLVLLCSPLKVTVVFCSGSADTSPLGSMVKVPCVLSACGLSPLSFAGV